MMARCRPGDLAIVISCPRAPENVGAIVRVIERMPNDEQHIVWACECSVPLLGLRPVQTEWLRFTFRNTIKPGERFLAFDDQLKPIRGPQADQGVQHEHEQELAA